MARIKNSTQAASITRGRSRARLGRAARPASLRLAALIPLLVAVLPACQQATEPAPDLTLALSADRLAVQPGGTGSIEVTVTRHGGLAGEVTLSLEGMPANVTAEFSPNPASDSSTLVVTATEQAEPGELELTVRGVSGQLERHAKLSLAIGGGPSEAGPQPEPPTIEVAEGSEPPAPSIAGIDGGEPRPLARLLDRHGNAVDFVENEVVVSTSDPAELAAFLDRRKGELLFTIDPSRLGAGDGTQVHLVRVATEGVDPAALPQDWQALDPAATGHFRVSSQAALRLLALVADEGRREGLEIGLNVLLEGQGVAERSTAEAGSGSGMLLDGSAAPYDEDAFEWPYMKRGGAQDIGVAEAWRVMEASGSFANRVRVLVADGGFRPNADFPPVDEVIPSRGLRVPNPDPTNCGGPSATASCTWHGTHVTVTGFGRPDNGFGAAGPGGPVTDLVVLQSPSVDALSIFRYILSEIPTAAASRPKIVNISASSVLPRAVCAAFVCGALDTLTLALREAGILVFAAAGNDGEDVDAKECVLGVGLDGVSCILDWDVEESATIPCELTKVICVGALDWDSDRHADFSNWGSGNGDTVDIFGPGVLWSVADAVGADESAASPDGSAGIVTGTSFASPFVAGVAALVWAADPRLDADEVARILVDTAHTGSSSLVVPRWVNALAAVSRALDDDTAPFVRIDRPLAGSSFRAGSERVPLEATVDDLEDGGFRSGGPLQVRWTSNLHHEDIASVPFTATTALQPGTHRITVTVTDSDMNSRSDSVTITVLNDPPVVGIDSPAEGAVFYRSQPVPLRGHSSDPNELGGLADDQVGWYLDGSSSPFARGHRTTIPGGTLSEGRHTITFRGSDGSSTADATVHIQIEPDPVGNLPPTAVIDSPPSPADGAQLLADRYDAATGRNYALVCLGGHGEDPDEASLIYGDSLTWYARAEGEGVYQILGRGTPEGTCLYARLYLQHSDGTTDYSIRLTVRDAEGEFNGNDETITVTVYGLL